MRKKLAVDMDNVIVDIENHWINIYEKKYGVKIQKEDLLGIPEEEGFPDPVAARALIYEPGFFRTAPAMPGAVEALMKLQTRYDLYIVSAAMEFPNSLKEKHDWLAAYCPFISWKNIIFCGDKSVVVTDYLIDDHLKNLDYTKATPILFTASHNVHVQKHTRVNNWQEVLDLLMKD